MELSKQNNDYIPDPLEVQRFMHEQGIDSSKQFLEQSKIGLKSKELSQK